MEKIKNIVTYASYFIKISNRKHTYSQDTIQFIET